MAMKACQVQQVISSIRRWCLWQFAALSNAWVIIAGPKTLCNACGVKRVRQMRMLTDGHKRRPPAAAAPPKTAVSLAKQSSGSLTSDSNAVVRRRDRSPAIRRPQRKVA